MRYASNAVVVGSGGYCILRWGVPIGRVEEMPGEANGVYAKALRHRPWGDWLVGWVYRGGSTAVSGHRVKVSPFWGASGLGCFEGPFWRPAMEREGERSELVCPFD